jgi:hypothetical protein
MGDKSIWFQIRNKKTSFPMSVKEKRQDRNGSCIRWGFSIKIENVAGYKLLVAGLKKPIKRLNVAQPPSAVSIN